MSRGSTILVLLFLIMVQATGALAGFWLPAIAPAVGSDLGLDPALIAYPVLTLYIFAMGSSLAAEGLLARFGAWRTSQIGLCIFALSHSLFMTGTLASIFLGSVTMGCAYGLITPAASKILAMIVTPANRNLIFSIRFTGVPLGGFAAGLIAPAAALAYGWQASMLTTVAIALALAVAMQPLRQIWDGERSRSARLIRNPLADLRLVWQLAPVRWVAVSGLCLSAVQTTLTTYTVTMLVQDLDYSLVAAGIGLSAVQIASVFGRLTWGWLADRVGSGLAVILLICAIACICSGLTSQLSQAWPKNAVLALCFAFGFVGMSWNGVYASEVARLSPSDSVGKVTGACMFIVFAGVLFGPLGFILLLGLTGSYTSSFLLTMMASVAALLSTYLAMRAEKKHCCCLERNEHTASDRRIASDTHFRD
ncbi:MAG: MFS transporter [Hyphomicrobiaceae bacterium]